MKLIINKMPFITMVTSAIEVYPKECYGALFGRRIGHTFTVEYAFAYQTAKRGKTVVDMDDNIEKCIGEVLQKFTRFRKIGDFHSHTTRIGTRLSSVDKKDFSSNDDIGIVVHVTKRKRKARHHRKALSGVAGDFAFDIAAYIRHNSEFQRFKVELDKLR